jgi:hypothetical protein
VTVATPEAASGITPDESIPAVVAKAELKSTLETVTSFSLPGSGFSYLYLMSIHDLPV